MPISTPPHFSQKVCLRRLLYSTYWRCTGANKPSSARQDREPSVPTLSPASPVPSGGSHRTCTELRGTREIVASDPRAPRPLAEKCDLGKEWLAWLRANPQPPRLSSEQLGWNSSSATHISPSLVKPTGPSQQLVLSVRSARVY